MTHTASNALPSCKQTPRAIAVLRTGALGDVCMTIPLLIALRDHFRQAKIYWIIDASMSALVADLQGIELITINKPKSLNDWLQCRKTLRNYQFDALLMPQASLRSNLLASMITANTKYGYGKLHSKDWQRLFINKKVVTQREHLVDSFMRFAQALGVPKSDPRWEINLSPQDQIQIKKFLPESNTKYPVIAICPTTSKAERNWCPKRFAQLIDHLQQRWSAHIVLIGGKDQLTKQACESIDSTLKHAVSNASGKTTLKQLCALLQKTDILICPDTGPAHLADALGTPVIGLYAVMTASKTGPYFSRKYCVDKYKQAVHSILKKNPTQVSWNLRVHSPYAMGIISVGEVQKQAGRLLEKLGFANNPKL